MLDSIASTIEQIRDQVAGELEGVQQINVEFDQKRKARIHSLYDNKVVSDDNMDEADREAELSVWKLRQAQDLKVIRQRELERAEEHIVTG